VSFSKTCLRIDYEVVKLLAYQAKQEDLENSMNPFASVILCQLAALKIKGNPHGQRLRVKFALTRRLYEKGFNKEQIRKLYLFIDYLIHLPKPLEIEYREKVHQLEEATKMAYISTIERMGIEQGMQQGLLKGRQDEDRTILLRLLQRKFGGVPKHYTKQIEKTGAETLLNWIERVLDASSMDEVFG
jgi:hypothetical protein